MVARILDDGEGILWLAPTWVPRSFCIPGRRIKLHPDDYYSFGAHRGGIDERWLSSTTKADNGPLTTPDEGLSYVLYGDRVSPKRTLFRDLVQDLGARLLGDSLWDTHHAWPMYSKFFDNQGPLPHHLHQMPEHAAAVGAESKPEGYYFPVQLNNHGGTFPFTFFGLEPGTTKAQVRQCLADWEKATTISQTCPGRTGCGRDGLVCACWASPRAGQPVHLRAAVGERCLCDVPVTGERCAHRPQPPGEGCSGRKEGRP